jgi:hypothetical protein
MKIHTEKTVFPIKIKIMMMNLKKMLADFEPAVKKTEEDIKCAGFPVCDCSP